MAELEAAIEDVQAIQSEYDGKPKLIPVAGWAAIRERLQHADVRAAMEGKR